MAIGLTAKERTLPAAGLLLLVASLASCTHFSVEGAVHRPGDYFSLRPITLEGAIEKAGGMTVEADTDSVHIEVGYVGVSIDFTNEVTRQRRVEDGQTILIRSKR